MIHHKFKLNTLSFFLLNLFCSGAVLAQQETPKKVDAHPPIAELSAITAESQQEETAFDPVVGYVAKRSATATRTDTPLNEIPQSITVIGAQQIQDLGAQTLMDTTRYTAGTVSDVFGSDNRTDAIYTRGSKTPLLEDGMPSHLSQAGYAHDEPFAYERVEVLRGSTGIVAGANPPGGVINLVSKRPMEFASNEIFAQYGSHDHKKIGVDLTGPINQDNSLLYRLIATGLDSGTQTNLTKRENYYIKPMVTWRPTPAIDITAYGEFIRNKMNTETPFLPYLGTIFDRPIGKIPYQTFIGEPEWDKTVGTRQRIGWEYNHKLSDNWQLRHHLRHTHINSHLLGMYSNWWDGFFNDSGQTDINGEYLKRRWYERKYKVNHTNADVLLSGKATAGAIEHNLLFAGNFDQVSTNQGSDEGDYPALNVYNPVYGLGFRPSPMTQLNKTKNKNWALTIQDQIKFSNKVILNLGLRYDKLYNYNYARNPMQKQQVSNLSKSAGLLWLAGYGFSPYISYSESFEPFYGLSKFDNSFLKPKESKQIEIGLKWQDSNETLSANMAFYNIKSKNSLTLDPAHRGYYLQSGEQKTSGLEIETAAKFQSWDIIAQYTLTNSKTTKGDALTGSALGIQSEGIPKHMASIWAVHSLDSLGVLGLRIGAGARYTSKITNGLLKENGGLSVHARTLFDAMISYETDSLKLALNVNNLANKKYVSICESGGRCWYGNERTIVGTLSYKF